MIYWTECPVKGINFYFEPLKSTRKQRRKDNRPESVVDKLKKSTRFKLRGNKPMSKISKSMFR